MAMSTTTSSDIVIEKGGTDSDTAHGWLTLDNVSKTFGQHVAVHPTTLKVAPGHLMSLLGPSGCGKTTSLRMVAGFESPDTGAVLIDGQDLSSLPPNRRKLGMVFQNYSLFPHLNVSENIAFGLKMAKRSAAEIAERVRTMLDLVQLQGYDERYPHQISGGQQQRVALARALVTNPRVLLLDEPLGALDKNLRESMQFELRSLQRRLGITTLLVTHDQEEALTMSDQVAVMNHGRILQIGSPTEVYEKPTTRFVAAFLGTSNLFEGTAIGSQGDLCRVKLSPDISGLDEIVIPTMRRIPTGASIAFVIRPEKLQLSRDNSQKNGFAIEALVLDCIFRGSYYTCQLRVAGRNEPLVAYLQAQEAGGNDMPRAGSTTFLSWTPSSAVLLDEDLKC
jgi:putative spermidine/putrescine transport system ATP-binding protein